MKINIFKKYVSVKNKEINITEIHNLFIVPFKERNKLLEFYHYLTGHRNYMILYDKIISENFYWHKIL